MFRSILSHSQNYCWTLFKKILEKRGNTLIGQKVTPFQKCCQNIILHDIKIFKSNAGHSEDGTKLNPIIIHDTAFKSSQKWTHFTHVIYSQYLKCFVFYNVWTPRYSPRLAQQEGGSWFGLGLFQWLKKWTPSLGLNCSPSKVYNWNFPHHSQYTSHFITQSVFV